MNVKSFLEGSSSLSISPQHCECSRSIDAFFFQQTPFHGTEVGSNVIVDTTMSMKRKKTLKIESRHEKDQNIMLPVMTSILAIFCPIIGCLGFLMCLKSEEKTPRYINC